MRPDNSGGGIAVALTDCAMSAAALSCRQKDSKMSRVTVQLESPTLARVAGATHRKAQTFREKTAVSVTHSTLCNGCKCANCIWKSTIVMRIAPCRLHSTKQQMHSTHRATIGLSHHGHATDTELVQQGLKLIISPYQHCNTACQRLLCAHSPAQHSTLNIALEPANFNM
jgi:hypothetical protein